MAQNSPELTLLKFFSSHEKCKQGIGTIIKIGNTIVENVRSLDVILNKLKEILSAATRQRIFTSYGLLLHCTFIYVNKSVF